MARRRSPFLEEEQSVITPPDLSQWRERLLPRQPQPPQPPAPGPEDEDVGARAEVSRLPEVIVPPDLSALYEPGGSLEQFAGQNLLPAVTPSATVGPELRARNAYQAAQERATSPYQPQHEPFLPELSPASREQLQQGAQSVTDLATVALSYGQLAGLVGIEAALGPSSPLTRFLPAHPIQEVAKGLVEAPFEQKSAAQLTDEALGPLGFLNALPVVAGPALTVTRANPVLKALLGTLGQDVREVAPQMVPKVGKVARAAGEALGRAQAEFRAGGGPLPGTGLAQATRRRDVTSASQAIRQMETQLEQMGQQAEGLSGGALQEHLSQMAILQDRLDTITEVTSHVADIQSQIEGLQALEQESPAGKFLGLVGKTGNNRGIVPETVTLKQWQQAGGRKIPPAAAQRPGGRYSTDGLLRDLGDAYGMSADEMREAIEQMVANRRTVERLGVQMKEITDQVKLLASPAVEPLGSAGQAGGLVGEQADIFGGSKPVFRGDTGQQGQIGVGVGERPLPSSERPTITLEQELAVNRGEMSPEQVQPGLPALEPSTSVAKESWEMTKAEFGVPAEPVDVEVHHLPRLEKIAREDPSRLTPADLNILAKVKQEQAARNKYLRLHKIYLPKANEHYLAVRKALEEGKPVPPEVLADYPDLAAKHPPVPSVLPAVEQPPVPLPAGVAPAGEVGGTPLAKPPTEEPSPEVVKAQVEAKKAAVQRLREKKPNSAVAERELKLLEKRGVVVADSRNALDDYRGIERGDYESGPDGAEEFRDARAEAYQDFLDTLADEEIVGEPLVPTASEFAGKVTERTPAQERERLTKVLARIDAEIAQSGGAPTEKLLADREMIQGQLDALGPEQPVLPEVSPEKPLVQEQETGEVPVGTAEGVPPPEGGGKPPAPPTGPEPVPEETPSGDGGLDLTPPRVLGEEPTRIGERIAAGEILGPEAQAEFQQKVSTYWVSSNKMAQGRARELMNTDPVAAYDLFMSVPETQGLGNAVETSLGMQLSAELSAAERAHPEDAVLAERASAIRRRLAVRSSVGGQATQQLDDWKNMGEAGIDYQWQKLSDDWQKAGGDPKRLQQQLRKGAEEEARKTIKANTERELAEASAKQAENEPEIARLRRQVAYLELNIKNRQASRRNVLQAVQDLFDLPDEERVSGAGTTELSMALGIPKLPSREPMIPAKVHQEFWDRAHTIKAMAPGPEQDAAKAALLQEIATYEAKAGKPKLVPTKPQAKSVRAEKLRDLEEPEPSQSQYERDHRYLTDDTVRDVEPRVITAPREAINKVKALYKHAGREMTDEQADTFLEEAAGAANREDVVALVERWRQQLGTARSGPKFVPSPAWLEKQAVEIEKLVDPQARQAFERLHSIERLAVARIMASLRRTGAKFSQEEAGQFLTEARALRNLRDQPLETQTKALDELVNRWKDAEPLRTALAKAQAQRDADAAARRLARQTASQLEALTKPQVPRTKTPSSSAAVNRAINVVAKSLRDEGVQFTEELGRKLIADAQALQGLTGDAAKQGVKDFLATARQLEPLRSAREGRLAAAAAKKQAERRLRDFQVLTGRLVPEAKQRARDFEVQTMAALRQAKQKLGVNLPDNIYHNFAGRVQEAAKLPAGMQRDRLYQSVMQDMKNLLPPGKLPQAMDLYGIPTLLKSAWDTSFMFRQGALLGFRHPGEWRRTWGPMLRSFTDPKLARQIQDQLATRPLANVVDLLGAQFDELWEGSEFFASRHASKIWGVAGSERSFVVASNKLRMDSIDAVIRDWLPRDYDLAARPINTVEELVAATGKTEKELRDMVLLYNNLSGKSNLTWLKQNRHVLSFAFWAPQWAISIPEAAVRTAMSSPAARKEGARVLAGYFGFVMGAEMLGDFFGVWDAEADPRSSNFGKVRLKGTQQYYDPTLGMGLFLRTIAQTLPTPGPRGWRPYHKTAAGELKDQPWEPWRDSALNRFLRGKLHPIAGEFWNWMEGRNIVGEERIISSAPSGYTVPGTNVPISKTALSVFNTMKSLFAPLTPQDIIEGVQDDGLRGGVLALPNVGGLSGQSYTTFPDQQQKVTDSMFPGKQYSKLDKGEQQQVNDSAAIQAEIAKTEVAQPDLRDKVRFRFDAYQEAVQRLETGTPASGTTPAKPGLRDFINAGLQGKALREKIQEFKHDRYTLAQGLLTPEVLDYVKQSGTEVPLHDVYAQEWLNVPLEVNLTTGELDYAKRDAARAAILAKAQPVLKAAGRTSAYITGKGEGTFRGKVYQDPTVVAMVGAYDRDLELVRPYFEIRDRIAKDPAYAKMYQEWKAATPQGRQEIEKTPLWKFFDRRVDEAKDTWRRTYAPLDALLKKWGYVSKLITEQRAGGATMKVGR